MNLSVTVDNGTMGGRLTPVVVLICAVMDDMKDKNVRDAITYGQMIKVHGLAYAKMMAHERRPDYREATDYVRDAFTELNIYRFY